MNANPPTLLLIEGNPEEREFIRSALGEDYRIIEADCGGRGLTLAADVQPACVLLDYFLPDMDGREFLTARGPGHDTEYTLLILTGNEAIDVAVDCLKQGAHDFLIKNRLTADGLRRAVHHGIETIGLKRQLALQQTELERAFAALQASETRLRLMIKHAPVALALFDRDMRYLAASRRWCTDFGLETQALIGRSHYEVFPELAEHLKAIHRRGLAGETMRATEDRFERADGRVQWLCWEVVPWRQSDGSVGGILIYSEDITARHAAEQALKATNLRLQGLLDALPVGVAFTVGLDPGHILSNPELRGQFELPPAGEVSASATDPASPGRAIRYFHAGHELGADELPLQRALTEGQLIPPMELEITRPSGRRWIAEVAGVPLRDGAGQLVGALAVTVDITARKRAEEDFRRIHAILEAALSAMSDAVFISDTEGRFLYFNDAFATFHKFPDTNVCAKTLAEYPAFLDVFFPDGTFAPLEQWAVARALRGEAVTEAEYELRRKDTGERWIGSYNFAPIRDADGQIVGSVVTGRDITARKHLELEMRRYQQIVETASEMLVFVDAELRYQLVNPAYAAFHHTTPEALRGRRVEDLEGPEIYTRIRPHLEASLAGEPRRLTVHGIDPSGQERWIEAEHRPFWEQDAVTGIVVSLHDLTEARVAQRTLEAERASLEARVAERTAELQASETKLRTIYDLVPTGISITDPTGRLVDCNRAAEVLLGVNRDEHLRRDYDDPEWTLLRPDGTPMPAEEYASVRAMAEQRPIHDVEVGIITPEGRLHWILVSAMPAPHPDLGVIIVYVDITDRKKVEHALQIERQRLQNVIDGTRAGTWEWRVQTGEVVFNERWAEIVGYRVEELEPISIQTWLQLVHPEDLKEAEERLNAHFAGRTPYYEAEARMRHKDGYWVWVADRGRVMTRTPDGLPDLMSGTHQDITALKKVQEQAEQATRAKSAFLAHMSHEIRTPMNGILGLAEIMLHRTLSPGVRADLLQIHQSATALLGLLNDVLDQSKLEAGRLTLERGLFDLEPLLATLRSMFERIATTKGLDFRIEVAPTVPRALLGDPLRLQQVLSNLIGNALKFTDRGEVRVRVTCEEPVGSWANLTWTVADTGIGMEAATLDRLFEPFVQGDDSIARRFGGTGLGLSISQHLVALMGGTLTVASTPGVGSTFTLRLHLGVGATPAAVAESTPGAAPDVTGARILVAEDQPLNQHVIGDLLRLLGAGVVCVDHGGEALERLAEGHFDAVLMDIQMPTMDGLTATRHIRENPAWATLPVIALTAGVTAPERARISAVGMNDLLPKPVTLDALRITLGRWLDRPAATTPWPEAPLPGAPTAPADALMIPGFDLKRLRQVAHAESDIRGFLYQFAETTRDDPQVIATLLAQGDTAAAARVHRLKGAAGLVGAIALSAAVHALEEQIQASADPTAALAQLGQVHGEALEQIARLPAPPAVVTAPAPGTLPDAARPLVTAIHARLVDGLLPPRALVAALEAALPAPDRALSQTLRYHLDRLDLRAALALLYPIVAGASTSPET